MRMQGFHNYAGRETSLAFNKTLVITVLAVILGACQSTTQLSKPQAQTREQPLVTAEQLSNRERSELYSAILAAELEIGKEKFAEALSHYLYALSILPQKDIALEAIALAQRERDGLAMVNAAETWLKIEPNNQEALEAAILGNLMLFDQLPQAQEIAIERALEHTQMLRQSYPSELDTYRALSALNELYLNSSTLMLWHRLLRESVDQPLAWTLLADGYLLAAAVSPEQDFMNKAEQSINVALQRDPQFAPAIDLKVKFLVQTEQRNRVVSFLQSLILDDLTNYAAHEALAQWFYQAREYDRALRAAQLWAKHAEDPEKNPDLLYLMAASYYGNEDFAAAHNTFLKLLDFDFKRNLVLFYCGDTGERIERYNQAQVCYRAVEDGQYWTPSQQRLAELMLANGEAEAMLARLDRFATGGSPEQREQSIVLKGQILQQLTRDLEALEWVARFINQERVSTVVPLAHFRLLFRMNPDNDWVEYATSIAERLPAELNLNWYLQLAGHLANREQAANGIAVLESKLSEEPNNKELLYARALMRHDNQEPEKMIAELKALYAQDKDNPNVQNALGYSLADANQELDYALELIQSAREKLPNNGAVLDSLGWVYYRLGQLDKAEAALKVALANETNTEVLAHYLEVLIENQKRDDAIAILQKTWRDVQDDQYIQALVEKYQLTIEAAQ